jgi:hypothetical protein
LFSLQPPRPPTALRYTLIGFDEERIIAPTIGDEFLLAVT